MPAASRLPELPAHRTFDRATVRLLLHARRGLALAVGLTLLRLGASRVVQRTLAATVQRLRSDLTRLEEENRYLRDRLARVMTSDGTGRPVKLLSIALSRGDVEPPKCPANSPWGPPPVHLITVSRS